MSSRYLMSVKRKAEDTKRIVKFISRDRTYDRSRKPKNDPDDKQQSTKHNLENESLSNRNSKKTGLIDLR